MRITSTADIIGLYRKWGQVKYSELISQTEHAVQCARLAEKDSASSSLVLAALLHDIGHLVDLESNDGTEVTDEDTAHEATGSRVLSDVLPREVRLPIALHVDAKRWLCTRQPGYRASLSAASEHSLQLQGGPMDDDEAARFEAMPGFADAVSLRLWDDLGKDPDVGGSLVDFERILLEHATHL